MGFKLRLGKMLLNMKKTMRKIEQNSFAPNSTARKTIMKSKLRMVQMNLKVHTKIFRKILHTVFQLEAQFTWKLLELAES
jgi:hypothetical protein